MNYAGTVWTLEVGAGCHRTARSLSLAMPVVSIGALQRAVGGRFADDVWSRRGDMRRLSRVLAEL